MKILITVIGVLGKTFSFVPFVYGIELKVIELQINGYLMYHRSFSPAHILHF